MLCSRSCFADPHVIQDTSSREIAAPLPGQGRDFISAYGITSSTGAIALASAVPAGTHPAAVVVDRTGKFIYVGNNGSIYGYLINTVNGALTG